MNEREASPFVPVPPCRTAERRSQAGVCLVMQTVGHKVGHKVWAIAEGYIPSHSFSEAHDLVSHEVACILNAGNQPADVVITLFFTDREPAGPYKVHVAARRTVHLRFNDLKEPEPVPRDTSYASVIESSVPVVVQHTRLDSRDPHIALLSTMAFPVI